MKPFFKMFVISILFAAFISACESITPQGEFSGKLISNSDCKSAGFSVVESETSDTLSCIEYEFESGTNKLRLKHINAGFNCCPGEISCTAKLSNDTIIIEESEKEAACMCDCLFDLNIEITGVEAGIYYFKIIEPFIGNQEKLFFLIDLNKEKEGTACATRKQYPWGMSQVK